MTSAMAALIEVKIKLKSINIKSNGLKNLIRTALKLLSKEELNLSSSRRDSSFTGSLSFKKYKNVLAILIVIIPTFLYRLTLNVHKKLNTKFNPY